MLALSHAREHHLRSAVESIRDQGLNYVEIADIAKSALTIPAPPVVLKEKYDADVAEMNERLVDRRKTLIEKGVECEEMRKALEREREEMHTARELLSLAAKLLRGANEDADRLAKLVGLLVEDGPGWSLAEWDSAAREALAAHDTRKP
jgi:hypothetical protein